MVGVRENLKRTFFVWHKIWNTKSSYPKIFSTNPQRVTTPFLNPLTENANFLKIYGGERKIGKNLFC